MSRIARSAHLPGRASVNKSGGTALPTDRPPCCKPSRSIRNSTSLQPEETYYRKLAATDDG